MIIQENIIVPIFFPVFLKKAGVNALVEVVCFIVHYFANKMDKLTKEL